MKRTHKFFSYTANNRQKSKQTALKTVKTVRSLVSKLGLNAWATINR